MKFTSVAILGAFLCIAAVSAAPTSSSPSFELNDVFGFDNVMKKFDEIYKRIECARDVMVDVIGETEFKEDLEEFTAEFKKIQSKWTLCKDFKCKLQTVKQLSDIYNSFIKKVTLKNFEMVKQIRKQIAEQCLIKKPTFLVAQESDAAKYYQCMVNAYGEASKTHGADELWSKYQPKFQSHVDEMKKCKTDDDCIFEAFKGMSGTVLDYSIELYQIGKEVVAEYAQNIIEEKCSAILPNEQLLLAEAVLLPNLTKYFGCVVNGYRKSAKKHGFEEVWSELEPQFQFYLNKMKKCQSDTCQMEAGAGLFGLLTRFTNDMMNDGHRDVIEDAMEIADKCVAPTPKFY